jgi:hypothetical protein
MLAGVPGVPTVSAREDRLRSKGRLRQQPAGDSTEENWSRAMKIKLPNGRLAKSRSAPIGATEAKDGMTPATTGLPSRCWPGGKALYKVPLPEQG